MALAVTTSHPITSSSEEDDEQREIKPVQAKTEYRCIMNITDPSGKYEMFRCAFKPITMRKLSANGTSICTRYTPDCGWSLQDEIVIIRNFYSVFNECKPLGRMAARSLKGLIAYLGLDRVSLKELLNREADPLLKDHCHKLQNKAPLNVSKWKRVWAVVVDIVGFTY